MIKCLILIVLCFIMLRYLLYMTIFIFSFIISGIFMGGKLISLYFNLPMPNQHGSKNIGTSNVARISGIKYAILVFLIDFFKTITILYIIHLFFPSMIIYSVIGLLLGHSYSGGKSVSVYFGILFFYSKLIFIISGIVWLLLCYFTQVPTICSRVIVLIPLILVFSNDYELSLAIASILILLFSLKK